MSILLEGLLLTDPRRAPAPGWIRVEADRIAEVGAGAPPHGERAAIAPGRLICPGFVDAHTHLPQFDSVGCDGLPLLEWLDRVVFPAEAWWGRAGAMRLARAAVGRMLRQGTLGFAGYLTSHGEPNAEVVRMLASGAGLGARARCIVGRVAMDRGAPDELTKEDRWRAARSPAPSPLLAPVESSRAEVSANPRFAIACSDELLAEIGWAVAERAASGRAPVIQTHLAESREEVARVAELFPGDESYTAVYDRFGLLTERTLLAHCVHLAPAEWELIRARGAVAVHCPGANVFLQSGLFDLDAARARGVRLALGSDVAAGPDAAMPRVARAMIEMAKARRMTVAPGAAVPTPAEAWDQITRANADALGWADAGRIEPGAAADLLALRVPETWLDEHLVGRLIYNWSSRLIDRLVVEGRVVNPATIEA